MDQPTKTETAQQLFARPQGATMDEVIAATGDYQYRALKRLQSRGYRIKRAKEGRATRYWALPPGSESFAIAVAPDGKMTLPKALRERLGVRSGGKVRVKIEEGQRISLTGETSSIRDLFGILGKPSRSLTVEEMNEAIEDAAVNRYLRAAGKNRR